MTRYDPSLLVEQIPPSEHFARECMKQLDAQRAEVTEMIERASNSECNPVKKKTPIGEKILNYVRKDLPRYLTDLDEHVEVYGRGEVNLRSDHYNKIRATIGRDALRYMTLLSESSLPSTEKDMYQHCLERSVETFNAKAEKIMATGPRKYQETDRHFRVPASIALPHLMQTRPINRANAYAG